MEIYFSIIGLLFSILYSGSEIALITSNALQIKVWQKQNLVFSKYALKIIDDKPAFITVILIGTNLANVLTTSFATLFLSRHIDSLFIIVCLVASIILFLGEIMPKTLTREFPNNSLLVLSPILVISYYLFYPFVYFLSKTSWLEIARESGFKEDTDNSENRFEYQYMYEQVDEPEAIEKDQQEMISQVFDYSETTVEEAMTPRTDISAVSETSDLEEVLHTFIDSGHSKILVYADNLDTVKGVIHLYDLFKAPGDIRDIIKPVEFIPYSKSVREMMSEFQTARHSVAVVLDEHGGTAGMVTAEDLFEELFGDFEDEFDLESTDLSRLNDGSILADAKVNCDDFNETYGNIFPEGNYETIAGYIISETGRIPNKGEHLYLSIGQVIISNSTARKIEKVKIYLNQES